MNPLSTIRSPFALALALAGAVAAGDCAIAQDPPKAESKAKSAEKQEQAEKGQADKEQGEARKAGEAATVLEWIERLGAEGFRDRKAAERALRGRVGEERVLEALREAADEHEDAEVRWRARRLVREATGAGPRGGLRERAVEPGDGGGAGREGDRTRAEGLDELDRGGRMDRIEQMFERMEEMFGRRFGPEGGRDPFGDLREQMRQMQQQLQELEQGAPGRGGIFFGPGMRGLGSSQSIQIGPDGVRVEVEEKNADGEVETKVYEADDLESFREEYPEIAERFGIGQLRRGMFFGPRGVRPAEPFERLRGQQPRRSGRAPFRRLEEMEQPVPPAPAAPPKGRRLGVYVGDLAPAVRDYLGLDEGVGLLVEDVADEGLAKAMGIEPRDVVVSINGEAIGGPADVARVLGGIAKGEDVVCKVVRKGRELELKAAKQHDAPERGKLREVR